MHPNIRNWIYVTGAPRSGTTFVGKVLSLPLNVDYLHEPFNPDCGLGAIRQRFTYLTGPSQPDIDADMDAFLDYRTRLKTGYFRNDSPLKKAVKALVGSRGPFYYRLARLNPFHDSAVIKDPLGCLATHYMVARYGVRPLVVVRHPVAFVASTLRLGWDESELDLATVFGQPRLVQDHLQEEGDRFACLADDRVGRAAVLWRALNKVLLHQARVHDWPVVTLEALSANPVPYFCALYRRFGLNWTAAVQWRVTHLTQGGRPEALKGRVQDFRRDSAGIFLASFRKLPVQERARILAITGEVAAPFYPADSFLTEPATVGQVLQQPTAWGNSHEANA